MAKVVITIEDSLVTGDVKTVCEPSWETLMQKHHSQGLSSGEAYALFVLNRLREASKEQGKIQLKIPQLRRPH